MNSEKLADGTGPSRYKNRRGSLPQMTVTERGLSTCRESNGAIPSRVLIVCKPNNSKVTECLKVIMDWLIRDKRFFVYLEEKLFDHFKSLEQTNIRCFRGGNDCVGLVICLGGDGTLLHAASLFQTDVPPIIPIRLGSLGFLTPFPWQEYQKIVEDFIRGTAQLVYRQRIHVSMDEVIPKDLVKSKNISSSCDNGECFSNEVLNEVTISKHHEDSLCRLEIFVDGHLVTTFIGDSLIVSTPTGSTAYSLSAGGSIVHPGLHGLLLTPVCPHSLSFRPVVLPIECQIEIRVQWDTKLPAHVHMDGQMSVLAKPGQSLRIRTSDYPVPCVSRDAPTTDWFNVLRKCLNWNSCLDTGR